MRHPAHVVGESGPEMWTPGQSGLLLKSAPTLELIRTKAADLPVLSAGAVGSDESGEVEALVAVTGNRDDGGDVLAPGGFSLDRFPVILWNHDWDQVIAKVLDVAELLPGDNRLKAMAPDLDTAGLGALWVRMLFDVTDPESVAKYRKVKFHQRLGWSIGWLPLSTPKAAPGGGRIIEQWTIFEASPLAHGMNREARTLLVKTAVDTRPPTAVADVAQGHVEASGDDAADEVVEAAAAEALTPDEVRTLAELDGVPESLQTWAQTVAKRLDAAEAEAAVHDEFAGVDPERELADAAAETIIEGKLLDMADLLTKRGRVLSARNEEALRAAMEGISKVLAQLAADEDDDTAESGKKGATVDEVETKGLSYGELRERLERQIREQFAPADLEDGEPWYAWVRDFSSDGWVVWTVEGGVTWRADFTEGEDGAVAITGDPVEVEAKVSYEPAPEGGDPAPAEDVAAEAKTMELLAEYARVR